MAKNQSKKGGEIMEAKDLWLVIGLTIILAVAVSLSTVSLTGNAAWSKNVNVGNWQSSIEGESAQYTDIATKLQGADALQVESDSGPIEVVCSERCIGNGNKNNCIAGELVTQNEKPTSQTSKNAIQTQYTSCDRNLWVDIDSVAVCYCGA